MTPLLITLCLCVLRIFVVQGGFVDLPQDKSILSMVEKDTILPCHYQLMTGETVVQVSWNKKKKDGTEEPIILAHHISGQTAFGRWSQRARFKSSEPTVDSTLVLTGTQTSDEGTYQCQISTFPFGNFETEMLLTVWTVPISSVEPVILVEGQSYQLAASCRSVARPPPRLSWDTDLNGQSVNRTSDNGMVSSHYSLHPLRNMNGKKLDCLVWHETYKSPQRITNTLVVHFPPHADVSGYNGDWSVGKENAALRCESGGNPKPHSFTWIRTGGELPEGVIPQSNGVLLFGRPLSSSDAGTYQCVAKNEVGVGKADVEITVAEAQEQPGIMENMLMIIVGGAAGGLLILMLVVVICVTCHHKRKNKTLKKELTVRKDEISTLTRQASFRRMNSISTDTRGATEENIPLRVEGTMGTMGTMRTSMSSLGEQAHCRDSRSTISGGRGGGGAFDYLGRPVLHNNSRRGDRRDRPLDRDEESRLRVETYQETRFHPPLTPSPFPMVQSTDIVRQLNGSAVIPADGGSRPGSVTKTHPHPPVSCTYPPVTDDEDEVDEGLGGPASQEHPDDQDSETNSSQVSEAHSTRYLQTNGTIRPKPRASPTGVNPHASLIHKAQIV